MNNVKQRMEELHDLSLPLVKFIQEHYHPHTKIIITDTGAELLTVELGCPVPVDAIIPVKEDK